MKKLYVTTIIKNGEIVIYNRNKKWKTFDLVGVKLVNEIMDGILKLKIDFMDELEKRKWVENKMIEVSLFPYKEIGNILIEVLESNPCSLKIHHYYLFLKLIYYFIVNSKDDFEKEEFELLCSKCIKNMLKIMKLNLLPPQFIMDMIIDICEMKKDELKKLTKEVVDMLEIPHMKQNFYICLIGFLNHFK